MGDRPEDEWRIGCAESAIERWRDDASFRAVVTVARLVNAMRFAAVALIPTVGDDSPSAVRQRINSFFYTGALVFEGFGFLRMSQDQLAKHENYRRLLLPLVSDPDVLKFVETKLHALRNRAVFHFDPTFIPRSLGAPEDGWYIFGRGSSFRAGDTYYDMADRSAMDSIVGSASSPEEFRGNLESMIRQTTDIAMRLLDGCDSVINEALSHADWVPLRPNERDVYSPPI